MMKYKTKCIFFVICLFTNTVFAHGVNETNAETFYVERPFGFLEFFISDLDAATSVRVDERKGYRYIDSDGLADHASGRFPNANNPNAIAEQKYQFRVTLKPRKGRSPTAVEHAAFGVASNGVPFDPSTAEYWDNDRSSKWNIDAINGGINLGLDQNNAHVHPNGAYHYHSIPVALMERADQYSKPVLLGLAADGFPIYGPFSYEDTNDMNTPLINMFPGYRVKQGNRQSGPRAKFNGTYTEDYEYVQGLGDLDECNGRTGVTPEYPDGTYYYVITDTWPFIPRCWMGKPDKSFQKAPGVDEGPVKKKDSDPRQQNSKKIDMRRIGMPSRDPVSACEGMRSGAFCSYRTRDMRTIQGTCRSNGPNLICLEIGR